MSEKMKLPRVETDLGHNGSPEDPHLHEKHASFLEKIKDRLSPEEIKEFTSLGNEIREQGEMSRTDDLTGLLNRRGFKEEWNRYTAMLKRDRMKGIYIPSAFLALDLDGFKKVNDTGGGHAAGDRFLQLVAEKSAPVLRETDVLGRIGGDEFCVFLFDATSDGAKEVAHDLRVAIEEVNGIMRGEYPEYRVNVSASIGVVTIDGEGHIGDDQYTTIEEHPTMEEIKNYADYVSYVVKNKGKRGERTLKEAWDMDPDRELEKMFMSQNG